MVTVGAPRTTPSVTFTLIGVCVVIYLIQLGTQYALNGDLPLALGAKINEAIRAGQLWRFFTPMFLHGSIIHILFNMYALYNFGPTLERHYGHTRFLVLFLLSGFAGNVISFMFSQYPSVGSSTAIFGLLGAEGVFLYHNRELFGEMARRALNQVVSIAVINLIIGLSPGIDNWGHIGGLLGGTLFAWFAGPLPRVVGMFPNLQLSDSRSSQAVWTAALGVAGVFGFLAAFALLFQR
jgi:rhomboid protease GluP